MKEPEERSEIVKELLKASSAAESWDICRLLSRRNIRPDRSKIRRRIGGEKRYTLLNFWRGKMEEIMTEEEVVSTVIREMRKSDAILLIHSSAFSFKCHGLCKMNHQRTFISLREGKFITFTEGAHHARREYERITMNEISEEEVREKIHALISYIREYLEEQFDNVTNDEILAEIEAYYFIVEDTGVYLRHSDRDNGKRVKEDKSKLRMLNLSFFST